MRRDVVVSVALTLLILAAVIAAPTPEALALAVAGFAGVVAVGLLVWGIGVELGWWE